MLKAKSKAKRVGKVVTLEFKKVNFTFNWEYDTLTIAQDSDGDVWAFNSREVEPTRMLGGTWCHVNETLFGVNKCKCLLPKCNQLSSNWATSLVEYKL
jgi:uncharacterized protein YggL (DUF469 family)